MEFVQRQHKFVHTEHIVGQIKIILQAGLHIIGVQHGVFGRFGNAFLPQRFDIGKSLDHHREVSAEGLDLTKAVFGLLFVEFPLLVLRHPKAGQELF